MHGINVFAFFTSFILINFDINPYEHMAIHTALVSPLENFCIFCLILVFAKLALGYQSYQ